MRKIGKTPVFGRKVAKYGVLGGGGEIGKQIGSLRDST